MATIERVERPMSHTPCADTHIMDASIARSSPSSAAVEGIQKIHRYSASAGGKYYVLHECTLRTVANQGCRMRYLA
jgi:hypothetical protein